VSSPSEEFGNKPKIRGILTAIAKTIAPNISALYSSFVI
jgi:hypothetical protein